MRVLALHLRTGALPWLLLLAVAVDLVVVFWGDDSWVGIWPQTGVQAQVPAYFLAFLAIGLAAWTSGARRRHHLDEQVAASALTRIGAEAPRFLAVLGVPLVPYLLGQVLAFALTARTFPPGVGLWAAYGALGAVVIVLATSLGWLLGKYLGSTFASLAAVITWLLVSGFALDPAGLAVIAGPPHLAPSTPGLAARAGAVLALTVAVLWAPPRHTEWSAPRLPQLLAAPVVLAAVLALVAATPGIVLRPIPPDPPCTPGQPQLCVWPEDITYLPDFTGLQERIASLPEGFVVADRFNEYGLENVTYHHDGQTITQREGDLVFSEGDPSRAYQSAAARIITDTTEGCDVDLLIADPADASLYRWLQLYLADATSAAEGSSAIAPGEEEAAQVAEDVYTTRTPEQQRQWVTTQLQQVLRHDCGR